MTPSKAAFTGLQEAYSCPPSMTKVADVARLARARVCVYKEGPRGKEVKILINPSRKARAMQFVLLLAYPFLYQLTNIGCVL